MLTLLFIIALAFMIVFIILGNSTQKHDDKSRANTIQTQIEMYEEENSKIEEKINTVVQDYLEHEKETYKDIKPENVIAALSMFPELNSSELVKKRLKYINQMKQSL